MNSYQEILKLASVWRLMKRRCEDPRADNYYRYGARGIKVCDEWQDQDTFIAWGLSSGYQIGLELDRTDNNGPYSPENCQWVTRKQNMRNVSTNRLITAWGETKPLAEWVDDARCSVARETVAKRIDSYGWTAEDAISTSVRGRPRADKGVGRKPITAFGETKSLLDWSKDPRCAVSYDNLKQRFQRGGYSNETLITHVGRLDVRRPKRRTTKVLAFEEVKSISDWAEDPRCLVSLTCLQERLRRGWDAERSLTTQKLG